MAKYKIPIPRYKLPDLDDFSFESIRGMVVGEEEGEEEVAGLINGSLARSIQEWRVALALDALGLQYMYQYKLFGGYMVGGYLVDFMVYYEIKWLPLEVQSMYWHSGPRAPQEEFRTVRIERALGELIRYVWEEELTSKGEAIRAVRKALSEPPRRLL